MTAVSGTFAATGQSTSFAAPGALDGEFNVSLSGTWAGTVLLQRSFNAGSTWITVSKPDLTDASFTTNVSFSVKEPEPGVLYRLNCSAYTSGTVTYRLGH